MAALVEGYNAIYTIYLTSKGAAMATTTMIHVRADEQIKAPNAETRAAMAEADEIARTRRARFDTTAELIDDIEKNSSK
jgi:hypothetical protein